MRDAAPAGIVAPVTVMRSAPAWRSRPAPREPAFRPGLAVPIQGLRAPDRLASERTGLPSELTGSQRIPPEAHESVPEQLPSLPEEIVIVPNEVESGQNHLQFVRSQLDSFGAPWNLSADTLFGPPPLCDRSEQC